MAICKYCGEDTDNMNHQLISITPLISDSGEMTYEEIWECIVTKEKYKGKLSKQASEESKKSYKTRLTLYIAILRLILNKEDPEALKDKGISYLELGNFKLAIADFKQAKNFNPNDDELDLLLGKAYEQDGKSDLADEAFLTAVRKGNKEAKNILENKERLKSQSEQ